MDASKNRFSQNENVNPSQNERLETTDYHPKEIVATEKKSLETVSAIFLNLRL